MILHRSDHAAMIRALRNAAPYIRLYKGKIFVVKAGGAVFGDAAMTRALIEQIAILHYLGVRVVMVHGGGPQLTELTEALGVPTRMVQGRRITDEKSIDATAMVLNGLINTRILAICRDLEIGAVGLSGVDAGLIRAHRRPPVQLAGHAETVDFGFVGDIDSVDVSVIRQHLDNGLMPVISPLSADDKGTLLNINADTVAAAIGAAAPKAHGAAVEVPAEAVELEAVADARVIHQVHGAAASRGIALHRDHVAIALGRIVAERIFAHEPVGKRSTTPDKLYRQSSARHSF